MADTNKTDSNSMVQRRNEEGTVEPEVAAFVNEFLQYRLNQNGVQWRAPTSIQEPDTGRTIASKVGMALRSLADEFSSQFKEQFVDICDKLEISENTLKPTIEGVANELFNEGIKWARIVALFVFSSELAMHCKKNNWPELINTVAHSLSSYISEKLLPWINDHGGWEGLIVFNEGTDSDQAKTNRWPSVKNLLCLGISAIGALTIGAVLTKS
ncbi:bcl-2-like protein 2 [Uloborus diversus]|uniref:bcl-2-like protein 2 n=1 Tax=Uloborus diversus TaxID=327109 RepID=UPI0024092006|nr:bcl-2-like protein 2 [Uloborus diversus]